MKQQLTHFGWCDFFAEHFVPASGEIAARVIAAHRNEYRVLTVDGENSARVSGRLRHRASGKSDLPAVGDWVVVRTSDSNSDLSIQHVLPRRSKFSRKAAGEQTEEQIVAANADTVWIVSSLDQDFSLRRIERYLALAWESGSQPVVVLTKADLCDAVDRRTREVESVSIGTPVHPTSSLSGNGVGELNDYLKNHATVALLGSSGVGKSTLINALAGTALQETGAVRSDGKGRHTTIHRQLLSLPNGGLVIDTPGMRELQLWDSQSGLADTFGEIDQMANACRFSDCRHSGEPGCAVTQAVANGELAEERLESYQKLQRELAHLERKQDARAQLQEKRRIKSLMKSLRHHPKYKR